MAFAEFVKARRAARSFAHRHDAKGEGEATDDSEPSPDEPGDDDEPGPTSSERRAASQ